MFGLTFAFASIILSQIVSAQRSVGDPCTLQATGSSGTCKLFSDCASARHDLKQHNRFPQTCGFEGIESIVCCEEGANNKVQRQPGEISKKKCRDVFSRIKYADPRRIPILILGGKPAERNEFPHMASIGYEPNPGDIKWLCGGSIISYQYILTAAHCLSHSAQGEAKWVRLGVTNLQLDDHKQDIKISERIPFPEYKANSHYHDIGLLKLEKPIIITFYVRPACLYLQHDIKATRAIATGWGQTQWLGDKSDELRKVTLDLFDHAFCNSSYKNHISRTLNRGIVDEIQICAGSKNPDKIKDTCQGDSGGPLQIPHIEDGVKDIYDIIGVTSFGQGCSDSPGVYVRVSNYIKWIEDTAWPVVNT